MNQSILKAKRRANPLINTDKQGNLTGYNPDKVSGTKQRHEHRIGEFYKHEPEHAGKTYVCYHFGDPLTTGGKGDKSVDETDNTQKETKKRGRGSGKAPDLIAG